jgi:hypothetical protein
MRSFRFFVGAVLMGCVCGWAAMRSFSAQSRLPDDVNTAQQTSGANSADAGSPDLVPAPLPDWFKFESNDTVNGWINSLDNKAITTHAWELWGALTTITDQQHNGQKVPIYETWWSIQEALAPPATLRASIRRSRRVLHLESPKQFKSMKAAATAAATRGARPASSLFSTVKYNDSIKKLIDSRKYNDGKELARINDGWGASKAIADRKLQDFDNDAVMLKPVYRLIPAKAASILPYWAGPSNSTNPSVPDPTTWTKKMVVIPPDLNVQASRFALQDANEFLPAVPLNAFYYIKLSKDDAAALGSKAHEGDYVILVGMHVSSREIDNWTWQTFWWSLDKPELLDAAKKRVAAPFDHYQVAVGYSFTTAPNNPDSLTLTCFNPYLEAGFSDTDFVYTPGQRGIESNCMSCHRTAAWPGPDQRYAGNGVIDPGNPLIFGGKTKTDFLWGIADRVAAPPAPVTQPAR